MAANALRPFTWADVSDCFFLASLIVAGATVFLTRARVDPAIPRLFALGLVILGAGVAVSLPTTYYASDSIGALARFSYTTIIWFSLGAVVLRTQTHVETAIRLWILSVAVSGLAAVAQVILGQGVFTAFTSNEGPEFTVFIGRQIGFALHPDDLGGCAAIAVAPALVYASSSVWGARARFSSIVMLSLVMACIALSVSITGSFVALLALTMLTISGHLKLRQVAGLSVALALASLSLVAINQLGLSSVVTPLDRVIQAVGLADPRQATGLSRLSLVAAAWDQIIRSPITGVGLDLASNTAALGSTAVHSMFLLVWLGAGALGFVGLMMMLVSILNTFIVVYRRASEAAGRTLVMGLGIGFFSFLLYAAVNPVLFPRFGWLPAAFLLALNALGLRRERNHGANTLGVRA